jgi:hypothetical protein
MFSKNPYIVGNPVGDSPIFVGRTDILEEVLRVLRHPQDNAIVLYGQRRIGKTSVLQALEAQLLKKIAYYPILFDLQNRTTHSLAQIIQELAYKISDVLAQDKPDLGAIPEMTFRHTWLPAVLNRLPINTSLVLLFDEFDALEAHKSESDQAIKTFFAYLRELLIIDQKRLNFVFVIGRNVSDLTQIALSLFKAIPTKRISLLGYDDTIKLVRFSEDNGSLHWSDEAIERVWQLTHGHPFLTQHLCSRVCGNIYFEKPAEPLTVTVSHINNAIAETLEASQTALEWLWSGLPPVERVVASVLASTGIEVITKAHLEDLLSVLASTGTEAITKAHLEDLLKENNLQFVIPELQEAQQLLQDWDLIEVTTQGYRFRVELLRLWIAEYKPLHFVQYILFRI